MTFQPTMPSIQQGHLLSEICTPISGIFYQTALRPWQHLPFHIAARVSILAHWVSHSRCDLSRSSGGPLPTQQWLGLAAPIPCTVPHGAPNLQYCEDSALTSQHSAAEADDLSNAPLVQQPVPCQQVCCGWSLLAKYPSHPMILVGPLRPFPCHRPQLLMWRLPTDPLQIVDKHRTESKNRAQSSRFVALLRRHFERYQMTRGGSKNQPIASTTFPPAAPTTTTNFSHQQPGARSGRHE
mmetsp:Transcript_12986/g.31324  ORF Transcript_12986/g.31324 Transcript_12986/m.31324 type:complete len:239 (+) Transcript_12986:2758-3474(+)